MSTPLTIDELRGMSVKEAILLGADVISPAQKEARKEENLR